MRYLGFFILPVAATYLLNHPSVARHADDNDVCYFLDGSVSTWSYRCDNGTSGHSACCQPGATCWSNGVCQYVDEGVQDWLRVGCTDKTWKDPACLDQCQEQSPDTSTGIRPCDGIDKGNRYCCDTGTYGVACCDNDANIFVLGDTLPTVVAEMPLISQDDDDNDDDDGDSSAAVGAAAALQNQNQNHVNLGLGLGLGLPAAAAAAAILGALWWRNRGRKRGDDTTDEEGETGDGHGDRDGDEDGDGEEKPPPYQSAELDSSPVDVFEMGGSSASMQGSGAEGPPPPPVYQGMVPGGAYGSSSSGPPPRELPGESFRRQELPT
ncbi:hypothetical protein F5X99DRAFT_411692 [Biscogniauxia marginata]|nr:hypothetical protein F5X99DRAFT_411692 [Biscogniauxia marginata]